MSTIKVNKIENTATADGGIAIDASGHVQVDGQQLPTAGALSNRNLIINGAMNVAQRGTSHQHLTGMEQCLIDFERHLTMALLRNFTGFKSVEPCNEGFANRDEMGLQQQHLVITEKSLEQQIEGTGSAANLATELHLAKSTHNFFLGKIFCDGIIMFFG